MGGRTAIRHGLVTVALTAVAACGGGEPEAGEPPAADSTVVAMADSALPDTGPVVGCPEWGLWRECNVQKRLDRAGVRIEKQEEGVRHDFLDVEGLVWKTARAEVQVFLYPSKAARELDLADVDTVNVSGRDKRIYWKEPAVMVTSGNLAAIVISMNPREQERIALSLGAGLPAR